MPEMIYSFNGKDITMNVCIQIRDVLKFQCCFLETNVIMLLQ